MGMTQPWLPRSDVEIIDDAETGARIYRLGELESLMACQACGTPIVPTAPGQKTCGSMRCRDKIRIRTPEYIYRSRQRNRVWCAENRGCKSKRPWLLGPPPFGQYLPGGAMTLSVSPTPKWPIEHRNVRALHGMVTAIVGEPHQRWPEWALIPWDAGCGWAVYFRRDEIARRMASRRLDAVLYGRDVSVETGFLARMKAPVVRKRGHQRVVIDAITPVVIQSTNRTVHRLTPTAHSLLSALTIGLPGRLGLVDFEHDAATIEVIEQSTQHQTVDVGGKHDKITGWVGRVVVDVNAVSRWLLEACARGPGFGGRTAFGFGRIRVSEAP